MHAMGLPADVTAGRAIGIDLGSKRIGVAVSDPSRTIAAPLTVLVRTGSIARDHRAIAELVVEETARIVVVGMPLNMDGSHGPAARAAAAEARTLATVVGVPVITHDERRSTVTADRILLARGKRAPARRKVIDQVAAAVILQHWLDAQASSR